MRENVVRRGAVSRFLFGSVDEVLSESEDALVISGTDTYRYLPFAEMTRPVHVVSGLIWATATVSTESGRARFRGFPKRELGRLVPGINARLKAVAESKLEARCAPLRSAAAKIEDIERAHRYARDSERLPIVGECEAALAVLEDELWEPFATLAQKALADSVAGFASESQRPTREANHRFVEAHSRAYTAHRSSA
jgi:hypothetical protein